jgi:arabinogalactan oligomer/maltooligosaccharide transport system substrate-binding protein
VTCKIQNFNGPGDLQKAVIAANNSGDVPDIFEGPHDQIGQFVQNGVLAPIDLGENLSKFAPAAVKGVTANGTTYGVPWALENIALLTNKSLASTCPATLDDAVTNAKQLIAAGTATAGLGIAMQIGDTGDAYHWYPLFTADGGYAFGENSDGTYNPDDMGVGKPGSIAAGTRLTQLVKDGILKASVTYDIARETFGKGKSPYFITGPWQIPEQQKALGANLMVCPIPDWSGSQFHSTPFIGVRAFMQTAKAKNPVLAASFLQDAVMTTDFMDGMFAVDPRPPAWLESFQKASADPIVAAFGSYGQKGIPTPSIAQMGAVWSDLGLAENKIANGADPSSTMTKAGDSINKTNAALK